MNGTPRTVLIGLDGATFTVLDKLMADGVMPFLSEFVASGVRAPLRSVVPALTPPAWTSLVTGRSPGAHGIFDFFRRESESNPQLRFLTSSDVGCETVWSYVNRFGGRATVLNFPLTFPAPRIDGYVVAGGWMPWRQLRFGCHPADLFDRLKAHSWFNPRELAMDMAHEEKAIEGCRREEYEDWIDLHIRRERQWYEVLRYLVREDPTDLVAILFDGVDKIQHLCWRFLDPGLEHTLVTEWEQRVRAKCLSYFRTLDELIAGIVDLAGPGATTIFASDHGFGAQTRTFFANAWLAEKGYLAWVDGQATQASETQTLGVGHLARHIYSIDWTRTRAYAPMPSGNGIHIVRKDDKHTGGVDDAEYESFRRTLIAELLAVRDPETSVCVVEHVWTREETFSGPFFNLAPDLTLELEDGGLLSILASPAPVVERRPPTGTHRPEGVFIAGGPDIRQGRIAGLSILDVAPLMLRSLDLPVPSNFEGSIPSEALAPSARAVEPVHAITVANTVSDRPADIALNADEEAEILRRLQALGYVE